MVDADIKPVAQAWDDAENRYAAAGSSSIAIFNVELLRALRPRWQRAVRPTPSMFRLIFTAANAAWYPPENAGDWVAVERLSDHAVEMGLWRLVPRRGESRRAGPVLVTGDRTRPENALPAVEALLYQVADQLEDDAAVVADETVTPGWRIVHIGFEGDDVEIGGLRLWSSNWGRQSGRISVAHPSYPDQRHPMWIYTVPGPNGSVVFAAGEFSNGVWGFFEPVASA